MKKFLILLVSVLILAACSNESSSKDSSKESESGNDGETVILRSATGNAVTVQHVAQSYIPWMDEVKEVSKGKVDFEFFTNGELVKLSQEIDSVLNGTVDVALGYPLYQPDQFPLADVTMLPLEESNAVIATTAWKNLIYSDEKLSDGKTFYESQFGDKGLFVLPTANSPAYQMATTGKEFNSVDDIVDTSLRTPSSITEILAGHLGVNSISMPGGEVYDALSRGAFDGSFISVPDWNGLGLQDLLKYEFEINAGHFNSIAVMSESTWDSLSEETQNYLLEASENSLIEGAENWDKAREDLTEEKKADGAKFVTIDEINPEVKEYIDEAKVNTWYDFIDRLEEDGLPGKSVAILWRDLVIEAGGKVPEEIMNLEDY